MSHYELMTWWRYYQENPFGYRRDDMRQALNCSVFAAPYSKQSLPLSSFLLCPEKKKPKSNKELANKLHIIFGVAKNGSR